MHRGQLARAAALGSFLVAVEAHAFRCWPGGGPPECNTDSGCAPVEEPGEEPAPDPEKPPPPPGVSVSCRHEKQNDSPWTTTCPGILIEVTKCDLYLGATPEESRIEFRLKSHSRDRVLTSKSVRWGHVGYNPLGNRDPKRDDMPPNPDREPWDLFLKRYPEYRYDNAESESFNSPISLNPAEERSFQQYGIIDFPAFSACSDVIYMYAAQDGTTEPPYLWNRNYACGGEPCYQMNFRPCNVHRGGGAKPAAKGGGTSVKSKSP